MDKMHQKLLLGTVHPYEVVQFGDAKLQFLGGFVVLEIRRHNEKLSPTDYHHGQLPSVFVQGINY